MCYTYLFFEVTKYEVQYVLLFQALFLFCEVLHLMTFMAHGPDNRIRIYTLPSIKYLLALY